jgi:glycosyltransferase involved in cell wall biosynthesis
LLDTDHSRKPSSTRTERRGIWLVLYLSPRKRGSQEQQLLDLAERLHQLGIPLTYVFSAEPPDWYTVELKRRGVDVRWKDFTRATLAAFALYRELVAARAALVHFHYFRASSPVVLAGVASGARIIVNDHIALTAGSRSRMLSRLKRLRNAAINPLIDMRLAVSTFVADTVMRYEDVPRQRITVVENGVPVARFASASPGHIRSELKVGDRPLVVCIARLASEKGVETAVRAIPHLRSDAVLAVAGDGALRDHLERLATNLGVSDRLRLLGLRNDVENLVAAADVSIVPSEWDEAFGQAVVESMAGSKAVVVTASGAMPEIVGDCGVVVPKRDPVALATAVNRLIDDPAARQLLGSAARRRAELHYSLERWTQRMLTLYLGLMPRTRGGSPVM